MTRYSLFVLKVSIKINKPTNHMVYCITVRSQAWHSLLPQCNLEPVVVKDKVGRT